MFDIMSFAALAGDHVVYQDGIQLSHRPLQAARRVCTALAHSSRQFTPQILTAASGE